MVPAAAMVMEEVMGGDPGGRSSKGDESKPSKTGKKKKPGKDSDDDPDSSSSDSDESETTKKRRVKRATDVVKALNSVRKVKEAETLKISNLPDAVGFRAWKIVVRNEVAAGSGRDDKGLRWILEVEADGVTFEGLAEPTEKFRSIDVKLAAALTKAAHGVVGRELALATETAAKEGKLLRGRQGLYIIHKWYKTNEAAGALYAITDVPERQPPNLHQQLGKRSQRNEGNADRGNARAVVLRTTERLQTARA
jgi:hypothetical protein